MGALLALLAPWPLKILIDNVIQHSPGPGIVVRLTNATGGNQITLMVVIVAAGLALTILAGALSVLENYVNTKLQEYMVPGA